MHINVRDFLAKDLGYHRTFAIEGEEPAMLSLSLTQPVNGELTVTKLEGERLAVFGLIATQLELECHRCLRSYTLDVQRRFEQLYATKPTDEELPIVRDVIDLAPLIEQEIILGLPIKQLCTPDCAGVPGAEDYQITQKE